MSLISIILPTISLLLVPLLIMLSAFILYLGGARYVFLDRVWFLIQRKGFHDEKLQAYHESQLDLERFKFMYRIREIENINAAHAAKDWADEVGLSLRTMGKARLWVDWEKQQINRPKTFGTIALALLFAAISITATIPTGWAIQNDVLVRFTKTKSWAWVGKKEARSFNLLSHTPWYLTKSTCNASTPSDIPLSSEDKKELCNLFDTPEHNSYISNTVASQRWAMGPLAIIMLWLVYLSFQGFVTRLHAIDMKRAVERARTRTSPFLENSTPETSEPTQP
ncbi:hypothetical protein CDEF62S_05473 [Castellaniella defragrans]